MGALEPGTAAQQIDVRINSDTAMLELQEGCYKELTYMYDIDFVDSSGNRVAGRAHSVGIFMNTSRPDIHTHLCVARQKARYGAGYPLDDAERWDPSRDGKIRGGAAAAIELTIGEPDPEKGNVVIFAAVGRDKIHNRDASGRLIWNEKGTYVIGLGRKKGDATQWVPPEQMTKENREYIYAVIDQVRERSPKGKKFETCLPEGFLDDDTTLGLKTVVTN